MKALRAAVICAALMVGSSGCAGTPDATTAVSTATAVSTQVSTVVKTVVSTVVSTVDPVASAASVAASKSAAAAAESQSAAAEASASAAAAAAAGPIYYSMVCDIGGEQFRDFPTYQEARKRSAKSCDASDGGGGAKHGQQLTATQKKALITAYGPAYEEDSLSALFGICGGVEDTYTKQVVSDVQVAEATAALLICPDHPNAKKIQASINAFKNPPPPVPDPRNVITYEITGSAETALVTYSQGDNGSSIGQENDVAVPWSKTVKIGGEYRSLAVSAQNGGDGDITCTIKVGGNVVDTVTSKGAYAIASCSSS